MSKTVEYALHAELEDVPREIAEHINMRVPDLDKASAELRSASAKLSDQRGPDFERSIGYLAGAEKQLRRVLQRVVDSRSILEGILAVNHEKAVDVENLDQPPGEGAGDLSDG